MIFLWNLTYQPLLMAGVAARYKTKANGLTTDANWARSPDGPGDPKPFWDPILG